MTSSFQLDDLWKCSSHLAEPIITYYRARPRQYSPPCKVERENVDQFRSVLVEAHLYSLDIGSCGESCIRLELHMCISLAVQSRPTFIEVGLLHAY